MLKTLVEHNAGYFSIISDFEQRPWGKLFVNTNNPGHHDSNHAEVMLASLKNLPEVVNEIEDFYRSRDLRPRIFVNQFSQPQGIKGYLAEKGYSISQSFYNILLWDNIPSQPVMRPGITVEAVEVHNKAEALRILTGEKDWGTPEMISTCFQKEFEHPQVQYYLARVNEEPAATGFLFYQGSLGRVENVRTLPEFRGMGCAKSLIRHMQSEFTKRGGRGLYLLADEETRGLYEGCGFVDMGVVQEYRCVGSKK